MSQSLLKKISDPSQPVIFYELVPPAGTADQKNILAYVSCAIELFESLDYSIDAINIPDIRDEGPHTPDVTRNETFEPKINAGSFAELLRNASHSKHDMILNHCTVYEPLEQQIRWLEETTENHHVKTVILVGGESTTASYPGPSVTENDHAVLASLLFLPAQEISRSRESRGFRQ